MSRLFRKIQIYFFYLTLALSLSATSGYAQTPKEQPAYLKDLKEGKALMGNGKFEQACPVLERVYNNKKISLTLRKNITFYLAKCYTGMLQYDKALSYYLQITEHLDPQAEVPIYEAARTYIKLGKYNKAEEYFQRLVNDPTVSEKMKTLIASAITQLPNKVKVSFEASLGFFGDTNVNSGPTISTIRLFGLPFELSDNSLPQKDVGSKSSLTTKVSKLLNKNNNFIASLAVNDTSYFNHARFDSESMTLSGTWVYRDKDFMLNTTPYYSYQWLDTHSYSQVFGLSVSSPKAITKKYVFVPYASLYDQDFNDIHSRSNSNIGGGITNIYTITPTMQWTAGLGYNHSNARVGEYSNDRFTISLATKKILTEKLTWGLNFTYTASKYRNPSRAFGTDRTDYQYVYAGNVDYSLKGLGLKDTILTGEINHINNRSNQSINQRTKTVYSISVKKSF